MLQKSQLPISTARLNTSLCVHLQPINLVVCQEANGDLFLEGGFPLKMLSAVIPSEHSYPAMPLT
jgi:hypothetical protein